LRGGPAEPGCSISVTRQLSRRQLPVALAGPSSLHSLVQSITKLPPEGRCLNSSPATVARLIALDVCQSSQPSVAYHLRRSVKARGLSCRYPPSQLCSQSRFLLVEFLRAANATAVLKLHRQRSGDQQIPPPSAKCSEKRIALSAVHRARLRPEHTPPWFANHLPTNALP